MLLNINMEYRKGILFVRLEGKLNKRSSRKLNNELVPVILKYGIKYLVYNLDNLQGIDKSGLKAILNGNKAIIGNNGQTYMCAIPLEFNEHFNQLPIIKTTNELTAMSLCSL